MARVGRVVVIGLMATDASGRQRRVVAVDVAQRASCGRVCAGQRERSGGMVERRVRPDRCVMAQIASLRESGGHVIRIRGAAKVRQVAGHASRAGQIVVSIHVAERTCRGRVCAGQREAGAVVVKGRTQPR